MADHPDKSPPAPVPERSGGVVRISLSLPADVYDGLDDLIQTRGYENRSQAVGEILRKELVTHRRNQPDSVMAGTISLFYDEAKAGIQGKVSSILRAHVKEVVSSLGVMLEDHRRMEVLVVQGPVQVLDSLVRDLNACRGLETGQLVLSSAILPPLYSPEPPRG
jgi:CopG family nickel-responsive transcriptional regulator